MPSSTPVLTEQFLYHYLASEVFAAPRDVNEDRVGVEVEFFPLISSSLGSSDAQPARDGNDRFIGLFPWLEGLASRYDWSRESSESVGTIAFVLSSGGRVTLEPGGQIEYSSAPFDSASAALDDVEQFEALLREEGEEVGLTFATEGFNRWLGGAEPKLVVEKPRYLLMDRHFERIGPFGRQMMRQTCATQINLDFGSAETATRRWQAANLIAPALNALFANSPWPHDGISHRSYRYRIWRGTDPSRAGHSVGVHESDPVAAYLDFALDASVMFVRGGNDRLLAPARPMTFRQWLRGEGEWSHGRPDLEDWMIHLTTLFPHVRPRGFMEIRSIDALPAAPRRVAVILTTELLYNDRLLDAVPRIVVDGRGSEASECDDWEERFAIGKKLLEAAMYENAELRHYFAEFAAHGLTPADTQERFDERSGSCGWKGRRIMNEGGK